MSSLEERLAKLEMLYMQQEQDMDLLSDQLYRNQIELRDMAKQLHYLQERFKALQPSIIASQSEETPPPHY